MGSGAWDVGMSGESLFCLPPIASLTLFCGHRGSVRTRNRGSETLCDLLKATQLESCREGWGRGNQVSVILTECNRLYNKVRGVQGICSVKKVLLSSPRFLCPNMPKQAFVLTSFFQGLS